jgi:hypothetical protein
MKIKGGRGASPPPIVERCCCFLSVAFQGQGYALATADAQGRQAFLGIALDHFVQQGHQHAATRGANRVADGDSAAIDVDLVSIPLSKK